MANVLSNLAADIYKAADQVGREMVGVIPSIIVNGGSEAAALNDTVRSHATRIPTVGTVTPSMTIPEGTDQTVDNKTLVIDQTFSVKIPWTGEDVRHVNNGAGFETVYGDQIAQALRAIVNQVETFMALKMKQGASRAWGTAGTTPFASNFNEIPQLRKILVDNGAPMTDGQSSIVLDTTAGAALRSLANLQKANESGNDILLRQGTLLDLQGFMLKESAGIGLHTKGTGASYLSNNVAGYAIRDTSIALDTGTGTVLQGDVVTFTGDTNKYVTNTALSGGSIAIGTPGLRAALADNVAMTVGNNYTANLAFHRAAAEIAIRPMAEPPGGDAAVDRLEVFDPRSGLSFVISAYKGYKKAMFDIAGVYGGTVWKSDYISLLLG